MVERPTEEELNFSEEVERKLLNIPLINYQKKDTIERVPAKITRNSVVEEQPKNQRHNDVYSYHHRHLIVKEIQKISIKALTIGVAKTNPRVRILIFPVQL